MFFDADFVFFFKPSEGECIFKQNIIIHREYAYYLRGIKCASTALLTPECKAQSLLFTQLMERSGQKVPVALKQLYDVALAVLEYCCVEVIILNSVRVELVKILVLVTCRKYGLSYLLDDVLAFWLLLEC